MHPLSTVDFSAGTQEDWRSDADDFPAAALGEPLGDWEGEVWVDINNEVRTCDRLLLEYVTAVVALRYSPYS